MSKSNELYIVLDSESTVENMVHAVTDYVRLTGFLETEEFLKDYRNAVYAIRAEYERLPSVGKRDEWKTALKRRRKEVGRIITVILDISRSGMSSNPVVRVTRSKISFFNGFDVEHEGIHPGSCWKAYRLFRYGSMTRTAVELQAILQAISTIFEIAKDLRLTPEQQDQDVLNQLQEITTKNEVDAEIQDRWSQQLDLTLDTISRGMEGDKEALKYPFIKRFVAAVKLAASKGIDFKLTPENLKLSNASSGASAKGLTMPAYIASMFEVDLDPEYDYSRFDMITGYQSGLSGRVALDGVKLHRNGCLAIEQHKDAMRLINYLANQFHDRLTYFEHYHKLIMFYYTSDDCFRQLEGRIQIKRWMRNPKIRAIYSLDLHAATNTLSIEWQDKVNRLLFHWLGFDSDTIKVLGDVWYRIMTFDSEVRLPHSGKKVRFKFASGQPMGFTDSFFSFSLLHHSDNECVTVPLRHGN